MDDMSEKTHYIAITCIIRKDGRYLVCKRSESERVFPGKWCVPGGKLEKADFAQRPHDVAGYWLSVLERAVEREVREETGLSIAGIGYVSNLAFLRPNGYATIIISLSGEWAGGEVRLADDELVDHAWVTLEEAKGYDLLENLWEQMDLVERRAISP